MFEIGGMSSSLVDAIKLLLVPIFLWGVWRDYRTRRIPNETWIPLLIGGFGVFTWETWIAWTSHSTTGFLTQYLFEAGVGLIVVPVLVFGVWALGAIGGADLKAIVIIGLWFPTYPTYYLPSVGLPIVEPVFAVFSFTVLTNAALIAIVFPAALTVLNIGTGNFRTDLAVVLGRPVSPGDAPEYHARLLDLDGRLPTRGVSLDVIAAYLDWRDVSMEELRDRPTLYQEPSPLPVTADGGLDVSACDLWRADAFLEEYSDADSSQVTATELRTALNKLTEPTRESVWVAPNFPFFVPLTAGLVTALTYGDMLIRLFQMLV